MSSAKHTLPTEWIDEIPTRASSVKALVVSVAAIMLSTLGGYIWYYGPDALESEFPLAEIASAGTVDAIDNNSVTDVDDVATDLTEESSVSAPSDTQASQKVGEKTSGRKTCPATSRGPETTVAEGAEKDQAPPEKTAAESRHYLDKAGYFPLMRNTIHTFGILGILCAVLGTMSLIRTRITATLLRYGISLVYPVMIGYSVLVWLVLFSLLAEKLPVAGGGQDKVTTLKLWWSFSWPAFAVCLYCLWMHAMLRSRSVYAAFSGQSGAPMEGDRVLEDLRTHGRDPRARLSLYGSGFTHWFFLILVPFLLQYRGCIEPYRPPKGAGENAVPVAVIKVQKKKKKKQLKLRPDSAIILEIPPLDETEVDKVIEEITDVQYETQMRNAKSGSPGKGGGKGPPGLFASATAVLDGMMG
jgi:hypothetical protein